MSYSFDWDDANIAHVAKHDVTPREAEEAYTNNPLYLGYSIVNGEERYSEVGETKAGRILVVVSTMRGDLTRIVTSYDERRSTLVYLAFKEAEHHGKENHS
jgi:uncharacterized DUF497 family protein